MKPTYFNINVILALLCTAMLFSCRQQPKTTNNMQLNWTKLSTQGLSDDLQKGVSAAYVALINGKLIVAGGCNFPDKPPYEGGAKRFYNEILATDTASQTAWTQIGSLPEGAAYGVSIQLKNSALWIGGNTPVRALADSWQVSLAGDSAQLTPFAPLPAPMDNFAGCAIGNLVFAGGGNVNGKPSNAFLCINAATDTAWTQLAPFPGAPRVQPVMAGITDADGNRFVYLLGGFFGGDASAEPVMAAEVCRYNVTEKTWEKAANQTDTQTQQPFSLGGGTAMPVDNRYILCMGGVNHDVFLDALTSIRRNSFDTSITDDERKARARAFSLNYMTQPVEYYKFNRECRVFDTQTATWTTIDVTPNTARAGASLAFNERTFFSVQGELKPGVRTAETWKGEIK